MRQRLEPDFRRANIAYPPHAFTLLAFKHEKVLELHAAGADGKFQYVRTYPILAASGRSGPKLREGDYQVPEGFYRVESLNPNSLYHLALRVNYPNEFDRTKGAAEHRENLGGDIMIHGSAASIGCLAMGDVAAEDLFVLAANTGIKNIRIVISPSDFRDRASLPVGSGSPVWLEDLYMRIKTELGKYPRPKSAGPLPQPGKMGLT